MTGYGVQHVYRFEYEVVLVDGSVRQFGSDEPVDVRGMANVSGYALYSRESDKTFFYTYDYIDPDAREKCWYWVMTRSGRVLR